MSKIVYVVFESLECDYVVAVCDDSKRADEIARSCDYKCFIKEYVINERYD